MKTEINTIMANGRNGGTKMERIQLSLTLVLALFSYGLSLAAPLIHMSAVIESTLLLSALVFCLCLAFQLKLTLSAGWISTPAGSRLVLPGQEPGRAQSAVLPVQEV